MRARVEAVLEPGEEVLWTGRKKARLGPEVNPGLSLFLAVFSTIVWAGSAILTLILTIRFGGEHRPGFMLPMLVFMSSLMADSWCRYLSIARDGRSAHILSVFFFVLQLCCWLIIAAICFRTLLPEPEAEAVQILIAWMVFVSVSLALLVDWRVVRSTGGNGLPVRTLIITNRRFGFLSPFPLFHANDRVVTTPLEGIADLSVLNRAAGVGDLTLVGKWSRRESGFEGPCTIYDVENVEDLARKLAVVAGVEPTIGKA